MGFVADTQPAPSGRFVPDAAPLPNLPPVAAGEAVAELATGAITKPLGDIAGLATIPLHAAGITDKEPEQVRQAIQNLTYRPTSGMGKLVSEYNPLALIGKGFQWAGEKAKNVIEPKESATGAGAEIQRGVARAAEESVMQAPALLGARGSLPKAGVELPAPKRPVGGGAASAVDEMQRQRLNSEAKVRGEGPMSAREEAILDINESTKPLREAAFKSPERMETGATLEFIKQLEAKNPDAKVRSALAEVRDTINRATEGSQGSGLPAAGTRVSVQDLKNMQGQSGRVPIAMADEIRQSLVRMIEAKGDKALDAHTRSVLTQVKERFLQGAPQGYKDYLAEYSRKSQALEPFNAEGSVIGKVTTDPAAFPLLNAADKQAMLTKAFESETPGRALSELVRDTRHSPQALKGVQEAYTDWLTQADAMTGQPTAKGLTKRWQDTREAAKSSGLLDDSHIAAMDKVMNDVRSQAGSAVKKAWASTGGFLLGQSVGHPIVGAHLARDVLTGSAKSGANKALESAVMKIAGTPEGAAALAAPPTPGNVAQVRSMLPKDIAVMVVTPEAQIERRRNNPLSMRPAGL